MTKDSLIDTKMEFLEYIKIKKAEIITLKHLITLKETELLLNTDFKELGLTNEKQRTAYINDELRLEKQNLDWLKYDLQVREYDVEIINDLIRQGEKNGIKE